ncbi:MAG: SDR family oxidoreductase [Spirochaetia bacterium]|jgi:NAD(P)-dependent dehydrogenase (short-subunit alcohol dehydrogenase family)|nr:SDR family oxidoreductase [Spirochaetia bacterium]
MQAVVVGGSSNIGRSICAQLVKEGYTVIGTYCAHAPNAMQGCTFRQLNNVDEVQVSKFFSSFTALDLLVNVSGVFTESLQQELDIHDFTNVFDVNVKGMFLCCKHAIPLLALHHGSIINIASSNAFHPGFGKTVHYDASKGAVVSYTRSLAAELGPQSIRVNAVAPGLINAPYLDRPENPTKGKFLARAVIKRLVEPEDIASAVLFLARNTAVTGQTICVDCGYLIG